MTRAKPSAAKKVRKPKPINFFSCPLWPTFSVEEFKKRELEAIKSWMTHALEWVEQEEKKK